MDLTVPPPQGNDGSDGYGLQGPTGQKVISPSTQDSFINKTKKNCFLWYNLTVITKILLFLTAQRGILVF